MPFCLTDEMTSEENFASRSKIRKRWGCSYPQASPQLQGNPQGVCLTGHIAQKILVLMRHRFCRESGSQCSHQRDRSCSCVRSRRPHTPSTRVGPPRCAKHVAVSKPIYIANKISC